jgi:hypothetical protein
VVRGVEVVTEGFCCVVERLDGSEGCVDGESKRLGPETKSNLSETCRIPPGVARTGWTQCGVLDDGDRRSTPARRKIGKGIVLFNEG